jgi:hypothetical protein
MCQKSLSVQGEHGDFRVVSIYEVVSESFHTFTLLAGAIVDCVCLVTGSFMPSTFPFTFQLFMGKCN